MKRHRLPAWFVCLTVLLFGSLLCSAQERVLVVGDEELRFTPAPERGYVIKLRDGGDLKSLDSISAIDVARAKPIRGLDRRGLWTVENAGPAAKNRQIMSTLRQKTPVSYAAPLFSANGETVVIIPEIVVRVTPGIEIEDVRSLCGATGCTIKKRMEFTTQEYLLHVRGPDAEAVFAAVEMLSQCPEVEWACPNTATHVRLCGQVIPNDEYFPIQWHLCNTGQSGGTLGADIGAPEAWEITTGDPNIIVAVVDSGVDTHHPDLIDKLVAGYDFWENDNMPDPATDDVMDAHGTACAGLIAARGDNGFGVAGVAWNCRIMPIRAMDWDADGISTETQADDAEALRGAANRGADILSNSWHWGTNPAPIIHSAIVDVTKPGGMGRDGKGCLVLFAAGNEGGSVAYPSNYPEVIAVGATDHDDRHNSYSNFGSELDIVGPGGPKQRGTPGIPVWTTDITGPAGFSADIQAVLAKLSGFFGITKDANDASILDYSGFGGTSSATPIVAGVVALILSVEPELTNEEVRQFLQNSAKDLGDPGWDQYYGWGRVDARAALDLVLAKRADLNDDLVVDIEDLLILIDFYGTDEPLADIAPATRRDGIVDELDVELLTNYWGVEMLDLGLLAHWALDETEGSVAWDSAGGPTPHDGTVNGDPQWQPVDGAIDGALAFDGIDDCVETSFVLDPAVRPFSVLAWVKGGAPGQVVISQIDSADWLLADPIDGTLMTGIMPPVARKPIPPLTSDYVITDGQWHRVGFVYDGTDRILYADGIEVARDTQASPKASSRGHYIGCDTDATAETFWTGLIDDVRIYNRAVRP